MSGFLVVSRLYVRIPGCQPTCLYLPRETKNEQRAKIRRSRIREDEAKKQSERDERAKRRNRKNKETRIFPKARRQSLRTRRTQTTRQAETTNENEKTKRTTENWATHRTPDTKKQNTNKYNDLELSPWQMSPRRRIAPLPLNLKNFAVRTWIRL